MRTATNFEGEISEEAIAIVKADPEVAAVYPFATQQVSYQGDLITVGAGDFNDVSQTRAVAFKSPSDARERMQDAIGRDAVTVNESFALRYKKQVGDLIELPTATGARPFEIVAIYYDYSSSRGWP